MAQAPDLPDVDQPAAKRPGRDGPRTPSDSPSPAGPASAVGIRLLDAPVDRREDSRAHRYVVDHLRPGTTIERRVMVKNQSETRRPVAVYAAAADVTGEGVVRGVRVPAPGPGPAAGGGRLSSRSGP